jgi:hypothetical protein
VSLTLKSAAELALALLKTSEQDDNYPPYQISVLNDLSKAFLGVSDRWIVTMEQTDSGAIQATMHDTDPHRDSWLTLEARSEAELTSGIESWREKIMWWRARLSVYRLEAGKIYRVLQDFRDYYGHEFRVGMILTYISQSFLPYAGGYTIRFAEGTIYLQEEDHSAILDNFDLYIETV